MAVNLRSCGRTLAVALALGSGACGSLELTGEYTPKRAPAFAPEFPVSVRHVSIKDAWIRMNGVNGELTESSPGVDWYALREELKSAIQSDLQASGPFRAPISGEAVYTLDVRILHVEVFLNRKYTPATVFGGLTLGVPFLLGMPVEVEGEFSIAVFQLFSPDGVLVLEESLKTRKNRGRGLYSRSTPLGAVFAPMVRDLKLAADQHRPQIRRGVTVPHYYDHDDDELDRIVDCLDPYGEHVNCHTFARVAPAPAATPPRTAAKAPPAPPPAPPKAPPPAPPPSLVTAAPQPATIVLAIGIDRYRDAPPADGAEADARRVDELFATTYNVPDHHRRLLLGDHATRSDIDEGLRWLAAQSRRGARAVVYFSGHGAPHPVSGQPHLVPYEADPADVTRTAMPLALLERRLAAMPAKDVVLIVDACFSGQGARSLAVPGARPLVFVEPTAQVVRLAAAAASETASSTPDGSGGLFTHYLLEALGKARADHDGDGRITLGELSAWLGPRVSAAARARGRVQTPSFARGPDDARDVVLGWGYAND